MQGDKSPCCRVGDRSNGHVVALFQTGILTDEVGCRSQARNLSGRIDGGTVHYIGTQSHGFMTDVYHAWLEQMGAQTAATIEIAIQVQSLYDTTVAEHGRAEIVSTPHSRGAVDLYQSRQLCSADLRNHETVITLGGAKMCPNGDFNQVSKYANDNDIVPLTDFFSFSRDDVNVIKTGYSSRGLLSPINDHLLES